MATTPRSFLASHRDDASRLVERIKRLSVRIPLAGKVSLPPPEQLAFYGALGALAAVSVIDWPVALAIGVGAAVVAHEAGTRSAQSDAGDTAAKKKAPAPAPKKVAPAGARGKAAKPKSASA